MNDQDAERVRTRSAKHWKPDLKCASCARPPTAPMLRDVVWTVAWNNFAAMEPNRMPSRQLVCSRPLLCAQLTEARHAASCEMSTERLRQLLCLECTERALGRQLTLDDLEACVGNYPHYVMQMREAKSVVTEVVHPCLDADELAEFRAWRMSRTPARTDGPVFTHCGARGYNGAVCTVQGFRGSDGKFTHLPGYAHDRGRHRDDSSDEEWEVE